MNTNADVSVDYFGVTVQLVVPRGVFDEVDVPEYYEERRWVKIVAVSRVLVAFTTDEPPTG